MNNWKTPILFLSFMTIFAIGQFACIFPHEEYLYITDKKKFLYDNPSDNAIKLAKLIHFFKNDEADSLITTFNKDITNREEEIFITLQNIYISARIRDFRMADSLFTELDTNSLISYERLHAEYQRIKGYYYYKKGEYTQAINYYVASTVAFEKMNEPFYASRSRSNIASVFLFSLENYTKADSLYNINQNLFSQNTDKNLHSKALNQYYKAIVSRHLSNYANSEFNIKAAIYQFEKSSDLYMLTFAYGEYANLLQNDIYNRKNIDSIYNKVIKYSKSIDRTDITFLNYVNKGVFNVKIKQFEKADSSFQTSLVLAENSSDSAYVYKKLAEYSIATDQYSNALKILRQAEKLMINSNSGTYEMIEYHSLKGDTHLKLQKWGNANNEYRKSIKLISPQFNFESVIKNDIEYSQKLVEVLGKYARNCFEYSKAKNDKNTAYIASDLYNFISTLIRNNSLFNEDMAEYHALEVKKIIFMQSIRCDLYISEKYDDRKVLDFALNRMNQLKNSRSIHMVKSIIKKNNIDKKHLKYLKQYETLEQSINKERKKFNKGLEESIITINQLQTKKNNITSSINSQWKFITNIISLSNVINENILQQWARKNDCSIISYISDSNGIIIYYLNNRNLQSKWVEINDSLTLNEMSKFMLICQDLYNYNHKDSITNSSLKLAHKIFPLVFGDTIPKNIIIVGEGKFEELQIGALMHTEPLSDGRNKQNWLIFKSNIIYSKSINNFINKDLKQQNLNLDSSSIGIFSYANSKKSELKQTYYEGLSIKTLFPKNSKWYKGHSANTRNLKYSLSNDDVVHISAHGKAGSWSELDNKIIFKNEHISTSLLNSFKIKPKLLFLNICESNKGIKRSGEGVLDMSKITEQISISYNSRINDKLAREFAFIFYHQFKKSNSIIYNFTESQRLVSKTKSQLNWINLRLWL